MGFFTDENPDQVAYEQLAEAQTPEHHAKLSHELIGAAAAFEAAKAYEEHCAAEGKPTEHKFAKELLAGVAGAFIDREFETKGLNSLDKEVAKKQAAKQYQANILDRETFNQDF
ncbi:hypothetical protein DFH07DRAFT_798195 [Mycena maculata]|uniref:CipC protein n=1 Tax=Mycena maculata TaxID=230809 RepID=A0AAD7NVK4_9AGAR|nr:hypothetical protein DFH07DRAFT_798195 [Mycena maculata]